ncbi:MAG: Asp-tRNA(Asn)/Glu-tRNA(Gln) amidotransferase subunit GatB [Planctomycetota bacterium]
MEYEAVIGLEVHVQLLTASKLFCGCPNRFTLEVNTQVCPVCLGHPGVLPVLNREAFEKGMKAALALRCEIAPLTKFDRKHYYYPDLPKNYQISQYDLPLARNGHLDIRLDGRTKRIGITRAHLEEDAGKLLHHKDHSVVDLNRTGTPLLEIVSEPELSSPEEAREYLVLLRRTLRYIEVSDCNMQEGSLRCDANISVRPRGETRLGVKNEIKNMNSFKAVEQALSLVHEELLAAVAEGREIRQVTWGYSLEEGRIFPMRTKEYANDYRYFPEPDLPPVRVDASWIERVRSTLPELPAARLDRFLSDYGLSAYDAGVLTGERAIADYFEALTAASGRPKESANWVLNDVLRALNDRRMEIQNFPVSADSLAELMGLVERGSINMPTARALFARLIDEGGGSPAGLVEAEGLAQVSDAGRIEAILEEAIAAHPKAAAEIEGGKHETAAFFFGQVMRALKGRGDPRVIAAALAKRFGIDPRILEKKKKKG